MVFEKAFAEQLSALLRTMLDQRGIKHNDNPSHIIPVMVGDPVKCRMSDHQMCTTLVKPQTNRYFGCLKQGPNRCL